MFNPTKAADQIKKEYIDYIRTTYHFRDAELQKRLHEQLNLTVSNGPFVEIKDAFKSGKTIGELIDENVLSPLFRNLESGKKYEPKLPLMRPLYLHQEEAIRKIVDGKNVVVSTGTGSGKTNCFLIPVINELLREKEKGTLNAGVRAIFIYPMNALANDQIKGLREVLMTYPDITFGIYNGGTENHEEDAIKLYETMYANEKYPKLRKCLLNEELSRDKMKIKPPHILFTNYAMLEHMLFRPGDDKIFSNSNFKFIILDEAHVYAGATGIETAFLMGRLKGRISGKSKLQFILTSATLGNGDNESNTRIINFAESLTGCNFNIADIIPAYREEVQAYGTVNNHPLSLYEDLANEENFYIDILRKYRVSVEATAKEEQILFDIITSSNLYYEMRNLGSLITLDEFAERLQITKEQAVAYISLCAKAKNAGKPLIDIRYHYFLRALDGCYLAMDYKESLSLIRKDYYSADYGAIEQKMFEVAVCEDCGEIALVGKVENGKLARSSLIDEREFYQVRTKIEDVYDGNEVSDKDSVNSGKHNTKKFETEFVLCKNCGAIVAADEVHNNWCTCGNTTIVSIIKLHKNSCLNCNGTIRHFQLGYEAATSVIATSLYEQIPEYTFVTEADLAKQATANIFIKKQVEKKKTKSKTGSQFLIFSDSRQGAAKFACFLTDSYKEFLRRRGICNVTRQEEMRQLTGASTSDFVGLLNNYFSDLRLFRKNNSDNEESSIVENKRNAWVAVLNELYNSKRDTSLVSLGKISFEYLGNNDATIDAVVKNYNVERESAKNFLNYLAFEIVRAAAVVTDNPTDINDTDRKYLFFTQMQQIVTKYKNDDLKNASPFMPTPRTLKDGTKTFHRSNKLILTKKFLKVDNCEAINFLENYWDFLCSEENERYKLQTKDGKGFYFLASSFKIHLGKNAMLWRCEKCGKITQFNIGGNCIQNGCDGHLERLDSEAFCQDNYYAKLYESKKISPLFVKEHTAQLAKKEALDYQQQFIRKEINALSCSTTFEMGVDVGDLETVFLRNIPPLSSNYAQRVGRAGRSINAAAFAITFARLSSHDFTFFDRPKEMISGTIFPPQFKLDNEKILKRHVYAVALSLYLKNNDDLYAGNDAKKFINERGYKGFIVWLQSQPKELAKLLEDSIPQRDQNLLHKYISTFNWVEEFVGKNGAFTKIIVEFEQNLEFLKKEYEKARKANDLAAQNVFSRKLERYEKNDLIDFLVRGNILPKYGFPVDSVELSQNIATNSFKSLNLSRDLSVAIAEYAPSSEVIADGGLYTSRYIRKPIVNKSEMNDFETAYVAVCDSCENINFSDMPIGSSGKTCAICGHDLKSRDFHPSIEPRAGFIAEKDVKNVPLSSQERKYKTEAIYIGDKTACSIGEFNFLCGNVKVQVESTANDSLVVKSTDFFYVCHKCGYSIAGDEVSKLRAYDDYDSNVYKIERTNSRHENPFGKGICDNTVLKRYCLHHQFKTDVAKLTFHCDTSDKVTMLSVMYALLNSFANTLNIEKRDIKSCLTYKSENGVMTHKIIIYDSVPGGAGHSRQLATHDGQILKLVIKNAIDLLDTCKCEPSCYRCLRSYENQKMHEILDRQKALLFLKPLCE